MQHVCLKLGDFYNKTLPVTSRVVQSETPCLLMQILNCSGTEGTQGDVKRWYPVTQNKAPIWSPKIRLQSPSQLLALNHMAQHLIHGSCWPLKPREELKLSQPEVTMGKLPRQSNANRPSQEGQISYREHGQERQTKAFQEITCRSPLRREGGGNCNYH